MSNVLFIANGHGENAIAGRIGDALADASAEPLGLDLLPLVGLGAGAGKLRVVGPRGAMPSGGLVAMGNLKAFARDVAAGFPALLTRQLRFIRRARGRYAAVVAVGDVYALTLALLGGTRPFFVGTAKSVVVAPYGPFERVVLRRAQRVYVRDEATARQLAACGTPAEAPGNVIADLARPAPAAREGEWLGLLPGSRQSAYADAVRLAAVARALAQRRAGIGALLSVAPSLDTEQFAASLKRDGWEVRPCGPNADARAPFEARSGRATLVAWRGAFGAFLAASRIVVGQAGTANEQAAAYGLPVVALQPAPGRREDWYRRRQRRLLGDGLLVVEGDSHAMAGALNELLGDPARMAAMGAAGRRRMGPPGGAEAIAAAILPCARKAA